MPLCALGSADERTPHAPSTYTAAVTLDPAQERAAIHRKYAPLSKREQGSWSAILLVILVLDFFFSIDWWVYAIGVVALVSWEITKFKLRRNADRFAGDPS